jgi:hypothetical protein
VLEEAGHVVLATDLIDYGHDQNFGRVDFLELGHAPGRVEVIVTNPPYKLADEFVRHALILPEIRRVVMLLRLGFLEGKKRSDLIDKGRLARVYPFANRLPMMHRDGWTGPRSRSAMPIAWFVWDADHVGPPTIKRIVWKPEENIYARR